MAQNQKKESAGWKVAIVSSLLLAPIGSLIYDMIKAKPILSTFQAWVSSIYSWIVWLLNYPIKTWYILVVVSVVVIIIVIAGVLMTDKKHSPDFIDYKIDKLKNWYWSWDYWYNSTQLKYNIINLMPYCGKCQMIMLERRDPVTYYCPKCEFQHDSGSYNFGPNKWEEKMDIEALILDNIDKKRYPRKA
ncbi:hypothetical protein [Daejeonella sp. JGW-45]|uniref:hypothetical protein n=1 Tax=Daejeonella sp. JGW-45 TaxID=3034148 RepID=UPI0023EDCCBA|nr:hypothetical protein [Daejeonella sp. JGW-45]